MTNPFESPNQPDETDSAIRLPRVSVTILGGILYSSSLVLPVFFPGETPFFLFAYGPWFGLLLLATGVLLMEIHEGFRMRATVCAILFVIAVFAIYVYTETSICGLFPKMD